MLLTSVFRSDNFLLFWIFNVVLEIGREKSKEIDK